MVYYTASITLIHSSEGKPPARCPPRLLGCRGGRAADETEAARVWRRVLTLGVQGGWEEGLAVAGELRRARPEFAAEIHRMLGSSFVRCFEHVKGLGLLEEARALAAMRSAMWPGV